MRERDRGFPANPQECGSRPRSVGTLVKSPINEASLLPLPACARRLDTILPLPSGRGFAVTGDVLSATAAFFAPPRRGSDVCPFLFVVSLFWFRNPSASSAAKWKSSAVALFLGCSAGRGIGFEVRFGTVMENLGGK